MGRAMTSCAPSLADAVDDARLGVEEPVAHAQREGELLDQLRLQRGAWRAVMPGSGEAPPMSA